MKRNLARATDARARTAPRSRFRRAPPHEDRIARERTRTLYPPASARPTLWRGGRRVSRHLPLPLCRIAKTTTPTMSSSWTAPKRAAAPDALASPPASKRPKATARAPPKETDDPSKSDLGRIFVAVRIRPLSSKELEKTGPDGQPATPMFHALDGTKIVEARAAWTPDGPSVAPAWEADAVFDKDDDNAEVYSRTAAPVVQAVLRGVNGTVMAYGQTSSGKTHTMSGTKEDPGVMALAVSDIFAAIESDRHTRRFDVRASYMEIYNEEIRDLLAPEESAPGSVAPIKLINGPTGLTQVHGLEERVVTGADAIIHLVAEGTARRSVGRTAMNAVSSRSHAVLRIRVASAPIGGDPRPPLASTLYVVDLAGSERADPNAMQTARGKQTRQEGSNINQSLLTLRLCVQRLAKASQRAADAAAEAAALEGGRGGAASAAAAAISVGHVPYRDSKLTRILQPALAGPGRTAIVAAVTPAASHVGETYSTLNFVGVAKSVKMEAKVNALKGGAQDCKAVEELRASAAAEAIRRKEAEEEHERALEELSRVGARLGAAESRAAAAAAAREFAEKEAAHAVARAKAMEARAEAAEKERDLTAASAATAASAFMDAKSGNKAEVQKLLAAMEEARRDVAAAAAAEHAARRAAKETTAELETARADVAAAKEAEEAALSAAARELEAAEAEKRAVESELRAALDIEKARCAAMKASLERARGRVVEAEKEAKAATARVAQSEAVGPAVGPAALAAAKAEATLLAERERFAAERAAARNDSPSRNVDTPRRRRNSRRCANASNARRRPRRRPRRRSRRNASPRANWTTRRRRRSARLSDSPPRRRSATPPSPPRETTRSRRGWSSNSPRTNATRSGRTSRASAPRWRRRRRARLRLAAAASSSRTNSTTRDARLARWRRARSAEARATDLEARLAAEREVSRAAERLRRLRVAAESSDAAAADLEDVRASWARFRSGGGTRRRGPPRAPPRGGGRRRARRISPRTSRAPSGGDGTTWTRRKDARRMPSSPRAADLGGIAQRHHGNSSRS